MIRVWKRKPIKLFAALVVLVALAAFWPLYAPWLAAPLVHRDVLRKADAIVVLGSQRIERTYEAGVLYRQGWAPLILLSLTDDRRDRAMMDELGIDLPTYPEFQRMALDELGVPDSAIRPLPSLANSTLDEARIVRKLALDEGFERLIVVTSVYHTARARHYFVEAADHHYDVILVPTRFDPSDPGRWWKSQGDIIDISLEYLKWPKAILSGWFTSGARDSPNP